jgi:hypothetical protein
MGTDIRANLSLIERDRDNMAPITHRCGDVYIFSYGDCVAVRVTSDSNVRIHIVIDLREVQITTGRYNLESRHWQRLAYWSLSGRERQREER